MKYTLLTDTNTETTIYEYQRNYTWNEEDFKQIVETSRKLFQKYPMTDNLTVELEVCPWRNEDPDMHFCKVQILKAWSDNAIIRRLRNHQQQIIETIGYYLCKQLRKLDCLISNEEYDSKTNSYEPWLGEAQNKIEYFIKRWQRSKLPITFDKDAPDKNLSDLKPHKEICERCFNCNEHCQSDEGNFYCNFSDVAPCTVDFKRYRSYFGDKPETIEQDKIGPSGSTGPDCCPKDGTYTNIEQAVCADYE